MMSEDELAYMVRLAGMAREANQRHAEADLHERLRFPVYPILTVTTVGERADVDPGRLFGYRHFWLKYIRAFNPDYHCAAAFTGSYSARVSAKMATGVPFVLDEFLGSARALYLCGVTPRYDTNLHLAFVPALGEVATVDTYNGYRVTIENARALDIPALPEKYAGMGRKYTTCRNWRFGVAHLRDVVSPRAQTQLPPIEGATRTAAMRFHAVDKFVEGICGNPMPCKPHERTASPCDRLTSAVDRVEAFMASLESEARDSAGPSFQGSHGSDEGEK